MSNPAAAPESIPHESAPQPKKRPEVLARATFLVRERLLDDVESLVARRHLEPTVAAGLSPRFGYKSQVDDVLRLVSIYRTHWAAIAKATRLREGDLEHAEALARELSNAFAPSLWSRRARRAGPEAHASAESSRAPAPAPAPDPGALVVEIGDCVIAMEIGPANEAPTPVDSDPPVADLGALSAACDACRTGVADLAAAA